jgi:hypothetical protein
LVLETFSQKNESLENTITPYSVFDELNINDKIKELEL